MKTPTYSCFCPCPWGLETALSDELQEIAEQSSTLRIHQTVPGGVHCSGTLTDVWRLNLHSRIASRILLRIAQGAYKTDDDVYRLALSQSWDQWFDADKTLRVDLTAIKSPLRSLDFATLRVKDGIVDAFRNRHGTRPSIDTRNPDIRVTAFLDANQATLYLDTSGESLFKRGWRSETGEAPLRENLAAGLLRLSGWEPGIPLFDPMCGSGTILIEAARIICGIPPGLNRSFAFESYRNFNAVQWAALKKAVPTPVIPEDPQIYGSDISGDMILKTRQNLENAGIPFSIPLRQIEAQEVQPPTEIPGILLTNPPYGERLRMRGNQHIPSEEMPTHFYRAFSTTLKQRFAGWKLFLFTADLNVPGLLRLRESRKTPLYNGALECRLFRFDMVAGFNRRPDKVVR